MASNLASTALMCLLVNLAVFIVLASVANERTECGEKLVGLAMCLSYVGGAAKKPSPECCSGLKTVLEKHAKCLCIVVKEDSEDPNLGLKFNSTLALNVPNACNVPYNLTTCIDLLHLAPNSTDAKEFLEIEKSRDGLKSATDIAQSHGSSTVSQSEWKEIVIGTFLWFFTPHLIGYVRSYYFI